MKVPKKREGPVFEVELDDSVEAHDFGGTTVVVGKRDIMLDWVERYLEQVPRFAQYVFRRLKYEKKIQVDYEIKIEHDERGMPVVLIRVRDFRDARPIVRGVITKVRLPKEEGEEGGGESGESGGVSGEGGEASAG